MQRRGGRIFGASITGVLNANAGSDEEARSRVQRIFGSLLAALFALDNTCAFIVLWLECEDQKEDSIIMMSEIQHDDAFLSTCIRTAIKHGFKPRLSNDNGRHGGLGDLFVLAVIRCILTTILLWGGVRMVKRTQSTHINHNNARNNDAALVSNTTNRDEAEDLAEPLLQQESSVSLNDDSRDTTAENKSMFQPERMKNGILVTLFITSTLYQVYAGLRVATFEHSSGVITPLLCLTVLWINLQAYVFRTLLYEMTRQDGIFLPTEVHRHPVYFESGRGLAIHQCDLCRKRIGGDAAQRGTDNNDENVPSCYRCSLCDFDVCTKCAQRSDAATVGENVLRGDRGVRSETSLSTASYFQRAMQVAGKELPLLLTSFLLLGVSSVSRLLLPHFQGAIIDKVVPDANGHYDKDGFKYYIQLYILVMIIQGAISTLYSAIFTLISRRLKFTIRNTLFEKILSQDVAYYDGTETGRLISRLTVDLNMMMEPIQSSLSSLLSNILILVGGLVMCFVNSYRLSMLAFVTVGPISYLWDQYAQWSKGLAREMISYWAEGNGIASQALSNIRTVKAFGCEDQITKKYTETNKLALDCGVKDAWGNGIISALTGYLDLGTGILILYFGGHLVYKGEMSVGELIVFQLYWNMMNSAYQSMQGLITSFTRSAAGAENVFSMFDTEPDIDPKKGSPVSWNVQGHLKLQDVSYYYQMRPDNIVLKKINLEVPAGKSMALVGRSGGGKSTIINLLLRFYDAKEGKLLLDGREYESLNVTQLRRQFGVVTQETELFPLSVEENIAYGLDKNEYTMDDIIHAAKQACAHEFIVEMKDGYQTRIGERGLRISGGQRQRLAIARVFLRKPKIILLDEATSALDEHSQEAVQQALANLISESNATVVLVAHRLSTVVNADKICVIDKGVVLEEGNHEELVAKGGIYASMVEKQLKKKEDFIDQEGNHIDGKKEVAADDIDALLAVESG